MCKHFVFITIYCLTFQALSQNPSDKVLKKLLGAKEVKWGSFYGDEVVRAQAKKTKLWGLYSIYGDGEYEDLSFEEIIPPRFDSLGWFEDQPFTIVKRKGKYGILLNPYEVYDAMDKVACIYDQIKPVEQNGEYYALVEKEDKWGLVDWFEGFLIVDPVFSTPVEVPLIQMDSWMIDIAKSARKALKADLIEFDMGNGDGLFRARNKYTKLWGMYQSYEPGSIIEAIPMEFDSVHFIPPNDPFAAVYKNGKVGIYLSYWSYDEDARQTVSCIYDDYRRFYKAGAFRLAVKKNNQWGWVDWLTGEEKSKFIYPSPDDLPYPDYQQDR